MLTLATVLADVQKTPDPDMVSPGFAGFLTVFLLTVAVIILIRSMVKHLRKVRYLEEARVSEQASTEHPVADDGARNGN